MPGERGILGVKKDPKKQMLFMYTGENWPSSDSEDSDYNPEQVTSFRDSDSEDSEQEGTPRSASKRTVHRSAHHNQNNNARTSQRPSRKRTMSKKTSLSTSKKAKTLTSQQQKSSTDAGKSLDKSVAIVSGKKFGPLPLELWLKIFHWIVKEEGALPFLCRATKVCHDWQDLATEASLWQKVDLTYGWIKSTDNTVKWLAQNRLSQCREINLSGWKNLTNDAIKVLCEHCPQLEMVNLSNCSKLTSVSTCALATHCPKLKQLDLSFTSTDAISVKSLKLLAESTGPNLTELTLAGNLLTGFNLIMNALMAHCPNLNTLDLSNCLSSTDYLILNVEKLQQSCPSMRVIRLANCKIRSNLLTRQCQGMGFTKLRELSCATPVSANPIGLSGVHDSLLIRLLHKAENLQVLDLRGCTSFCPMKCFFTGVASPILSVEQLYLAHSGLSQHSHALVRMMTQWRHSLRVLDLSWISPAVEDIEAALRELTDFPSCPLTHLNLAGSPANLTCVIRVLDKLQHLQSLDLTSCRSLPRGIKCLHTGDDALRKLRNSLHADNSASDTDSY